MSPRNDLKKSLDYIIAIRLQNNEAERLQAYPIREDEVANALENFRQKFRKNGEFEAFLSRHDANLPLLSVVLSRTLRAGKVLDAKVRLRAQVSELEVRRYFEENIAPSSNLTFEQTREAIREKLFDEKMRELAERELEAIRRNGDVRILARSLNAP